MTEEKYYEGRDKTDVQMMKQMKTPMHAEIFITRGPHCMQ